MFNVFAYCNGGQFASIRLYLRTKHHFMRLGFEDIFDSFLFVMAATKFGEIISKFIKPKLVGGFNNFLAYNLF